MPTKIETHLSPEQFLEFCRRVASKPGGSLLKNIQAEAEEFGIDISLMAARSFKKGPFEQYLDDLKEKREMAETVSTVAKGGLGLADASAAVLSQKIFDDLMTGPGELSIKDKNTYSLALSRLRTGDQRGKFLEAKLEEMAEKLKLQQFDAVAAARKNAKAIRLVEKDAKLDDSAKTERVRQLLFGDMPADFTPVVATGDSR